MEKELLEIIDKQNKVLDRMVNALNTITDKLTHGGCGGHGNRSFNAEITQEQISYAMLEEALLEKGIVNKIKNRIKNPIKWNEDEQV